MIQVLDVMSSTLMPKCAGDEDLHSHVGEGFDHTLMSLGQHRELFLVGKENASGNDQTSDWLSQPT